MVALKRGMELRTADSQRAIALLLQDQLVRDCTSNRRAEAQERMLTHSTPSSKAGRPDRMYGRPTRQRRRPSTTGMLLHLAHIRILQMTDMTTTEAGGDDGELLGDNGSEGARFTGEAPPAPNPR